MTHGTIHWNELNTRDAEAAKKFYADSLGVTFDGMPMPDGGTYWVMKNGDAMVAGIFDISGTEFDGVEPCWMTYFAVDDIDKRLTAAKKAGAQVMKEPWDVPGVGRMALLMQPDKAMVAWMTPSS